MANMENLENTLDTNMIRQAMSMMDGMTSCDKFTDQSSSSQNKQRRMGMQAPNRPSNGEKPAKVLPNW